jgi:hypothetical protein
MNQITIYSKDPNRIKLDEAEELAKEMRALLPDQDILVKGREPMEEGRAGVTWFQIIEVMIPAGTIVGKEVIQELTKAGILWAKKRFASRSDKGPPVYIPIYGPDGRVIKSVVIKNSTDKPEDRTEHDQKRDADFLKFLEGRRDGKTKGG